MQTTAAQTLAFGAALTSTSLLVGRAVTGSTTVPVTLDEVPPTVGAAALQSVTLTPCVVTAGDFEFYGSSSADGRYALFPCGSTANTARLVVRAGAAGDLDASTTYTTQAGRNTFLPRGVASPDGTYIYAGDNYAIFRGPFGGVLTTLTTTNRYFGQAVANFTDGPALLTFGCAGSSATPCPASVMYGSTPALPGAGAAMDQVVPGFSAMAGSGAVIVAAPTLVYVGLDETTANGGLYRFTSATGASAGPWTQGTWPGAAAGAPRNPSATAVGVHGLTGRAEAGVYTIYLTTSATSGNALYRYDTTADNSAAAGAGFTLLSTAAAGTTYLCVVVAPIAGGAAAVPTPPSGTPSASVSHSPIPTPSNGTGALYVTTSGTTPPPSISIGAIVGVAVGAFVAACAGAAAIAVYRYRGEIAARKQVLSITPRRSGDGIGEAVTQADLREVGMIVTDSGVSTFSLGNQGASTPRYGGPPVPATVQPDGHGGIWAANPLANPMAARAVSSTRSMRALAAANCGSSASPSQAGSSSTSATTRAVDAGRQAPATATAQRAVFTPVSSAAGSSAKDGGPSSAV